MHVFLMVFGNPAVKKKKKGKKGLSSAVLPAQLQGSSVESSELEFLRETESLPGCSIQPPASGSASNVRQLFSNVIIVASEIVRFH